MKIARKATAIAGAVAAATLLTGSVATAPAAYAYPGDPSPGCDGQVFAMYCDGPIRPDGTFKRCTTTYSPSTYVCRIIDNNAPFPPIPLGQPDHHID